MFEITSQDIANLTDDDLRSLVGYLCEAEVRALGLSTAAVTWGGNQNAPDGGIDVRVQLPPATNVGGFLPQGAIGFQVKKTDFTPGLIGPEMRPSGVLRESIRKLAEAGGAYIIASSGTDASDSALQDRLKAMNEALQLTPDVRALHVDFYDRSRLASWTRSHPGLMLWVRQRAGRAIKGWQSYDSWAFSPEGLNDAYLLDDKARLHAGARDEKGVSVVEGMQKMRAVLGAPRGIARLAGLSGVGKTRLVQALFDERVGTGSLDPSLVAYTDMSNDPDPQPTGMAHDLIASRTRAIVIVDNCAPALHRSLSELGRRAESTVSVLTVEYDIKDDEPEGTDIFRLEPSTPELVGKLIERRFPEISKVDAHTIGRVSDGNARVAIALANTLGRNETLVGVKDEDLFTRLFHQRQVQDNSLLKAAQACALLYSFQGEALSGEKAELPIIASLIGTTARDLYSKVATLKERDFVQRRGEWRAILPHAIANDLAILALKSIPLETIEQHFNTDRLMRSFAHRLGYLHKSEEAIRVAKKWLAPDGFLKDIAHFNDLGITMFAHIAPVSPSDTLAAIERSLQTDGPALFAESSRNRDRIASVLRSLAFDPALFDRAVAALMQLVEPDNGKDNSKTVRDMLTSLFHIYLSGTHAPIEQRLRIVDRLLRSAAEHNRNLGGQLLDALLQSDHFSSFYSFEFGLWPRDFGYAPRKRAEISHWYTSVLGMARQLLSPSVPVAASVASEIAGAFRGLWNVGPEVQTALESISTDILGHRYWEEGWIAARTWLSFAGKTKDEASKLRLRELEKRLRPKTVLEQVRAIVLTKSAGRFDFADIDEGEDDEDITGQSIMRGYEKANAAAEQLGKEVANDITLLNELLPALVSGDSARLSVFGKGLAAASGDKRRVWDLLIEALNQVPTGERNVGAFAGFLWGTFSSDASLVEEFLEDAVEHAVLATWFPLLQTAVPISVQGAQRLKLSIQLEKAPVGQYRVLGHGRATDAISGADLKPILLAIANRPSGYGIAIDVLSMRLHSDRDTPDTRPPEVLEAGRALLSAAQFESRDDMHEYHLEQIIKSCLKGPEGEAAARTFCGKIKEGLATYKVSTYNISKILAALFKAQPQIALDVLFEGLNEVGEVVDTDTFDDPSENHVNPLDSVPDEVLLEWCASNSSGSRYLSLARAITYVSGPKDAPDWSPIALKLLDAAPDPIAALSIFIDRFSPRMWSGSRAAILESRLVLLNRFEGSNDAGIAALFAERKATLEEEIKRIREWETKHDSERDERFE